MLAYAVDQRQVLAELFTVEVGVDIPVKNTKCYYWHTCEHDIVQLDVPLIEDCHGAEPAEVGKKIVRHRQRNILVEKVEDEIGDACVASSSMDEDQPPQLLKLGDGKVRGLNCSHAFVAKQTDSNVGFIDHGDVVVPVTDSHSNQTLVVLLDHADHVSLLFGRDATADNGLARLADPDEVLAEPVVVADVGKGFVLHNDGSAFLELHKLFVSHDAF